jgi:cholesterol transport system auxiliary component
MRTPVTPHPRLHPISRPTRILIAAICALAIAGCASNKGEPATQFDFGPAAPAVLAARTYANSRWSATPLQLLTQRLKTRIGQAGAKVLSETDASSGIPILRVDVDDFVHDFTGANRSAGVVALRASVFKGHALIDQHTFVRRTDAISADAAGGARALASSTDAVAADIAAWLASLDLTRR